MADLMFWIHHTFSDLDLFPLVLFQHFKGMKVEQFRMGWIVNDMK